MSIPAYKAVWRNSKEDGQGLLLMLALADAVRNQCVDSCWPSINTLAKFIRRTPRQVRRLLRSLESQGELACEKRAGRVAVGERVIVTNKYQLTPGGIPIRAEMSDSAISTGPHQLTVISGHHSSSPGHFQIPTGPFPAYPADIAMSAKPVASRSYKSAKSRNNQTADMPGNKSLSTKGLECPIHPKVSAGDYWRPSQDYSRAVVPDINDYSDIHTYGDPVLVAMAITGERDKRGWGNWVKWMGKAAWKWGADKAICKFRQVLDEVFGALESDPINRPGALLNKKLAGLLQDKPSARVRPQRRTAPPRNSVYSATAENHGRELKVG